MDGCAFCRISAGELPASIVCSDELTLTIMDVNPVSAGHLLVIPRRHTRLLGGLDEETGARLFVVAMRLTTCLRAAGPRCEAVRLVLADGEAAGQVVPHVHLHLIPRNAGASQGHARTPHQDRSELDRLAEDLGRAYRALAAAEPARRPGCQPL